MFAREHFQLVYRQHIHKTFKTYAMIICITTVAATTITTMDTISNTITTQMPTLAYTTIRTIISFHPFFIVNSNKYAASICK